MKVTRKEDLIHQKPKEDYPYSASAKVFQTDQLFLYSEKVEPGKRSSAPHFHKKFDEIITVMKGELCAYEGEEKVLLKAGDSICFFANSQKLHFLENQSSEDAEFLLFRKNFSELDVVY